MCRLHRATPGMQGGLGKCQLHYSIETAGDIMRFLETRVEEYIFIYGSLYRK